MAKIKLTKTVVEATQPQEIAIEPRDTIVPGFLCKITPAGRRVFMLQYRTNAGERRKPALGQFGELTVEQARILAQWVSPRRRRRLWWRGCTIRTRRPVVDGRSDRKSRFWGDARKDVSHQNAKRSMR